MTIDRVEVLTASAGIESGIFVPLELGVLTSAERAGIYEAVAKAAKAVRDGGGGGS